MYHWRYLPLSLSSASRHSLPLVRSLLSHFCTVSFAKEQISIPYQSCNNNKKQNKNKRRNKQKHSCLFPCEQTVSDTNCGHMVERSDFHYPLELGFWVLLYPLPANGYTQSSAMEYCITTHSSTMGYCMITQISAMGYRMTTQTLQWGTV